MMLGGHLFAVLLIPVVSSFDGFLSHRKSHESGSVRHLKAKEAVHESGSDLVFSWAKCVICDGYDVRLYLQDVSGKQEIPYKLKSAMTALKVTNVAPRTSYKLVVKRLPTDTSSSEVSGRSFAPDAPSPVENLKARAITKSSVEVEWNSRNADGFIARILKNSKLISETVIPDFSNHTLHQITNLEPGTDYDVQVTAFYFPPSGKSSSAVESARVRTLPTVLPTINLKWDFDQKPRLFWVNPASPAPVTHQVTCSRDSRVIFGTRISGSADSVELSTVSDTSAIECVLDSWFSKDEGSKVTSRAKILKPVAISLPASSQSDRIQCGRRSSPVSTTSGNYEREHLDGTELTVLKFWQTSTSNVNSEELQYKLCEGNGPCGNDWITSREYARVVVSPSKLKSWIPHTVYFRFKLSCTSTYDSRKYTHTTTVGSFKIPASRGTVDPVLEISGAASQVSWKYSTSSVNPDYFLVTHCTGDSCISQSAPGRNRSISLGELKPRHVYFVTIQAVKLWDGEVFVSATKMTSIVAPKPEAPDGVIVTFNEIGNSSTVQLTITHNVTSDEPPVVEYHVAVCSKPVSLWGNTSLTKLLTSNGTCDSTVSTNSSLDLIREPWTSYEISVLLCYGSFDFNDPVNLTLPIFKPNPSPVTGLSWDAESATLKWEYEALTPSGFSISICPSANEEDCHDTLVDSLDRQYSMDKSNLGDDGFVAFVHAYFTYEGVKYDGLRSKVVINSSSTTQSAHQNVTIPEV